MSRYPQQKKSKPHEVSLHVRNFPPDLRRDLRTIAASKDLNVRELVIGVLKRYASRNKTK